MEQAPNRFAQAARDQRQGRLEQQKRAARRLPQALAEAGEVRATRTGSAQQRGPAGARQPLAQAPEKQQEVWSSVEHLFWVSDLPLWPARRPTSGRRQDFLARARRRPAISLANLAPDDELAGANKRRRSCSPTNERTNDWSLAEIQIALLRELEA